jgi:hypothetical protein
MILRNQEIRNGRDEMNAKENANAALIKMYNAEVAALKAKYPGVSAWDSIFVDATPEQIALSDAYQVEHHEINTRYSNIFAALRN